MTYKAIYGSDFLKQKWNLAYERWGIWKFKGLKCCKIRLKEDSEIRAPTWRTSKLSVLKKS